MYGLVNKAIQDMVCSQFGQETWGQIKQKAAIEADSFISMEGYPDDVTHRLVKAASAVLGLSSADIMKAFGEFWVRYTAEEGYGELLDMCGETLPEFLQNLDDLHARVGVTFPKLQPPSFECTEASESGTSESGTSESGTSESDNSDNSEQSLKLHYYSERPGLAPMVIGLVQGLGQRFDSEVEITQTHDRANGADHDEFLVRYKQPS